MSSGTRLPGIEEPALPLAQIARNLNAEGEAVSTRYLSRCCRRKRFHCVQRDKRWRTKLATVRTFLHSETRTNGFSAMSSASPDPGLTAYMRDIERRREAVFGKATVEPARGDADCAVTPRPFESKENQTDTQGLPSGGQKRKGDRARGDSRGPSKIIPEKRHLPPIAPLRPRAA